MKIELQPVAFVKNSRTEAVDDHWGNIISEIELVQQIPEAAFDNIELFSHLDIFYFFDKAAAGKIEYSRSPRGNPAYPVMGVFAQRSKDRPNHIGLARVQLLEHSGRTIRVKYLDAIHGTPVLDIKPVFQQFETQTAIMQPAWVNDLTKNYW
jgi:tRNA (adenine37-N6)-methyltransferase